MFQMLRISCLADKIRVLLLKLASLGGNTNSLNWFTALVVWGSYCVGSLSRNKLAKGQLGGCLSKSLNFKHTLA